MRRRLGVAGLVCVLILCYGWFTPGRTARISTPHGIASLERVYIGGIDQYILARGDDSSNPVLLFLHGGPGMPAMYLSHAFQRELEKSFVVVQWDRRGAGKSYGSDLSSTLNSEQLVSDTVELTNILRARFHQDKIYLVAHSWGTYLGMLVIFRRPDLYRAYVGIGQLALSAPIASIQDNFIRQQAKLPGNNADISELNQKGIAVRETLLFKYGGELHRATSFMPLLLTGLMAPEYNLRDVRNIPRGVSEYHRFFVYNSISGDLMDSVTSVDVPVYFFSGRFDYTDPFELSQAYLERLNAPAKHFVWFENSAHFPFYEEPAAFAAAMRVVLDEMQNMANSEH